MRYLVTIPSPFASVGFIEAESGELSSIQAILDKEPSIIYNPHFAAASNESMPAVNQASPSTRAEEQDEEDSDRLFHIVTPDPGEYSPVTHAETKESYYFLKLGRGRDYHDYQQAKNQNPVISIVSILFLDLNEWYKVVPKSKDELRREYKESEAPEAWTHDNLRSNMIAQQRALRNKENEEYERLIQELLGMCNIRKETDIDRDRN
ncbi:unnamed protein product [Clonostachys solani]|uniref:Uncharacterized protein n=1 Tax=Clonostachys solani TaxID=160281 RepID=A0A9N9ZHE3_9HYPO|nr:unnamed protein product [Clonostachys solani]